ncbi:MAG TPA: AAA family ATPase [Candidatus Saccharimonadales bacterium]
MSFIYVTGAPGIGKTTIQRSFKGKGMEVYDLDDSQFGGAHNKVSGKKVDIPPAEARESDWFDKHEWRLYKNAFELLKQDARNKDIIVFGVSENDSEILDLFDKVIYLLIGNDELKERLRSRIDNDYGKKSSELNTILARKKKLDEKYLDCTYKIDASRSLNSVSNDILNVIKARPSS